MYEVMIEEEFSAAHALRGYRGKCENPHGHNYRVRVTLAGEELDHIGLLYDFKDLKAAMGEIIDRLDHQFLNDLEPFKSLNPSAENLARYFYQEASSMLRAATNGRLQVKDVTVWETDTTTARYYE